MRTLRFIVAGMDIRPDPTCDFSGIVPGTKGFLEAEFIFSPEWNGFVKAVGFWQKGGKECEPKILKDGKSCIIPSKALEVKRFEVKVFGKKDDIVLSTDRLTVCQDGRG